MYSVFVLSISGNSLSNFWYGSGTGFGGVGGVANDETEKNWANESVFGGVSSRGKRNALDEADAS